jgi:hypothetical protein
VRSWCPFPHEGIAVLTFAFDAAALNLAKWRVGGAASAVILANQSAYRVSVEPCSSAVGASFRCDTIDGKE